jgi:hypothetical protein
MVPQRGIIKRQRQGWKMNKHSSASLSYLHNASFCRIFGFYLVAHSPDTNLLSSVTLFTLGRLPILYEYGGKNFFRNTGSMCVCVCVCVCVRARARARVCVRAELCSVKSYKVAI